MVSDSSGTLLTQIQTLSHSARCAAHPIGPRIAWMPLAESAGPVARSEQASEVRAPLRFRVISLKSQHPPAGSDDPEAPTANRRRRVSLGPAPATQPEVRALDEAIQSGGELGQALRPRELEGDVVSP